MITSLIDQCKPSTFTPSVFGAEILHIDANLVQNYTAHVPAAFRYAAPTVTLENATFCNVTVTYTHPGQDDEIHVEVWLPEEWNGNLYASGGAGYAAGRPLMYPGMAGALHDGFAAVSTDAGVDPMGDPTPWALKSPGNVDLNALQNLAHVSLNDLVWYHCDTWRVILT